MTGPEHYREAERILALAIAENDRFVAEGRVSDEHASAKNGAIAVVIAAAQVHATLALAAATAQNIRRNNAMDAGLADDWIEVSR